MPARFLIFCTILLSSLTAPAAEWPGPFKEGYLLPNGWRITPFGEVVHTEDLILNIVPTPDGKSVVALTCGYNPHQLVVVDCQTDKEVQRVSLPTAWFGLAWSPDGTRLFVSGGNNKSEKGDRAPIYVFGYADGRLTEKPMKTFVEDLPQDKIFWSGVAHHPTKDILFAANRTAHNVVVFDTSTGERLARIPTELNPYDLVLSADGRSLYCSNWASDSVSVIDTDTLKTKATIGVGDNPNDMLLTRDGRLFVCCSNDNEVVVVDTAKGRPVGSIATSLYPQAPEGSTPNALAMSPEQEILYVANADNYNVCVVDIEDRDESQVLGFIPAGWYPSALAVSNDGEKLYIGNGKGVASYATPKGPRRPNEGGGSDTETVKTLQKGAIGILKVDECRARLRELTEQAYKNCPYNDDLLAAAIPPVEGNSVVPSRVGVGSPIEHVVYIIKENRTYDQVFGDLPQGNGDPSLCLFNREVSPNHHAIAEQFVLFDNLYCDAEVSRDGHQWSNAAYATDFVEKNWPASYGGMSEYPRSGAMLPSSGYIWDQCAAKGLTYRSYGEFGARQSEDSPMQPNDGRLAALHGHVAPDYCPWKIRDTENAKEFLREFEDYENHFDDDDPEKRLPNFVVMALPEDHTHGTRPGIPTPQACVASNDYALGMIVERLTHSRYWPQLAIFVIEDDAQNGPDHVDARRTVGLAISPYIKRKTVDSTMYTTSSMLRTMELLLGLQPMSQYDAAATPMYAAFGESQDLAPYDNLEPLIDLNELNVKTSWGVKESLEMDLSTYDQAPMFALNEIIWKSVKGADSEMPLPIHRFQAVSLR